MTGQEYDRIKKMFEREMIRYPVSREASYNKGIQKCLDVLEEYYRQQAREDTDGEAQHVSVGDTGLKTADRN